MKKETVRKKSVTKMVKKKAEFRKKKSSESIKPVFPSKTKMVKHSGRFKKGEDPRRAKGRPKGTKNKFSVADLRRAIENVEKRKHQSFMEKWIESAWGDANAMSKVMNFMLPQLKSIEGTVATFESNMDNVLAESIQKKLRKRFE